MNYILILNTQLNEQPTKIKLFSLNMKGRVTKINDVYFVYFPKPPTKKLRKKKKPSLITKALKFT